MKARTTKLRRYDTAKRGSFEVSMWFYDWELSTVIGSLRAFQKDHEKNRAYASFLGSLEDRFSKALGKVLKAEFRDLKLGETKPLSEERERG